MRPEVKAGDIFCSRNPMALGKAINVVQKIWSKDNDSEYTHAGIIVDSLGTTFEALWTIKHQDFFEAYKGTKVLVGRHKKMTRQIAKKGWDGVKGKKGWIYPFHRLFLFIVPPLAKYISLGLVVCTELTMLFLCCAGLANHWRGWNPDDVADMIRNWKNWEIVFEGVLE